MPSRVFLSRVRIVCWHKKAIHGCCFLYCLVQKPLNKKIKIMNFWDQVVAVVLLKGA